MGLGLDRDKWVMGSLGFGDYERMKITIIPTQY